jgi:hypothetical protein
MEIQKLRFYVSTGSTSNSNSWTVYLGHTTKTGFTTSTDWVPFSALTQVFTGNVTIPSAGNWIEIVLSTPFNYNNTDNLVVAVDENTPGYGGLIGWGSFASGTDTGIYYRSDSTNPNPSSPPTASGRATNINRIQLSFPSTNPPVAAITPIPADLSSQISINSSLSWVSGGGDPTGYDVYFGTTLPAEGNPNIGHESQTSTSFNPGLLQYSTTYYWKVVPRNAFGTADMQTALLGLLRPWQIHITSFPYTEGFNNTTFPPVGWVNYQVTKSNGLQTTPRVLDQSYIRYLQQHCRSLPGKLHYSALYGLAYSFRP